MPETPTLDVEELIPVPRPAPAPEAGRPDIPATLAAFVTRIRPDDPADAAQATLRIHGLASSIRALPEGRMRLGESLREWVAGARAVPLLAEEGILSTRGFFAELRRRLYERVLPAPPRPDDARDALDRAFDRESDAQWVAGVDATAWADLADAAGLLAPEVVRRVRDTVSQAIEVLAMRVAGEALESELLDIDPEAGRHDSPFLALQREISHTVTPAKAGVQAPPSTAHAEVLLAQCLEGVARLRRIGRVRGSSVRVTYLLERMEQHLRRIELLLAALAAPKGAPRREAAARVFATLVEASATRLAIGPLWSSNTRLIARRVTENASRTGEHYVAHDRAEYFRMMRAAMGAGVFVALMALLKLEVKGLHLPPLFETLLVCADYAVGFVVIHILHFAIATKQPAMTAATIAATVEDLRVGRARLDGLVELIAAVVRTQLVAIVGNVALALPVALAIATLYAQGTGATIVGAEKAQVLLGELHPIAGFALLHAAVAGVWLFVAGLVSGWYDNRCTVLDIPARIRGSPRLRALPEGLRDRFASYIDGNLGALMGNTVFGILLGATAFVGFITGLPIDIRHVAFASANLGYAAVTAQLAWAPFLAGVAFVLMVGLVNLAVSFSLALYLAMRSRGVTFARSAELLAALGRAFRHSPRSFLLPPR